MKHADTFYDDYIRQFIHHFANKERMDRMSFKKDLKKIGMEQNEKSILKECSRRLNRFRVDSYDNTKKVEDAIIKNNDFSEKLIYFYLTEFEDRLTRDILIQMLHFIGQRIYIYTFSTFDKNDYDFYFDMANQANEYFKINKQSNKKILDNLNLLRRYLYLTMHKLEFLTVPYRFKETIQLVTENVRYSQALSREDYVIDVTNYIQINMDHLQTSINKSESYINKANLNGFLKKFVPQLQKYAESENCNHYRMFDALSGYFKLDMYTLMLNLHKGETIDEKFRIRLLVKASKLISIFYGRTEGYELFFNRKSPEFDKTIKEALTLFSKELQVLLNEEKLNVFEPLYLVFSLLNHFNEYSSLNKNVYLRLKFISQSYNRRTYYLLSTTLYLKLLNDRQTFLTEIEKVKKNIEANPTITLITLYNNEIDTIYDLDAQTRNNIKVDPYIITILDCVSQISKNVGDEIIRFRKEHEEDEDFFYRDMLIRQFENEFANILILARDPNLFRGLNQFYTSFLNIHIKSKKMDFREDFVKKLDQIKIDLLDINPLDLQLSLIMSRLWKLNGIFKMNDPERVFKSKTGYDTFFESQQVKINPVISRYLKVEGYSLNDSAIKEVLEEMYSSSTTVSSLMKSGPRMLKIVDGFISKVIETSEARSATILSLYQDAYIVNRKKWVFDPIMLYYLNHYLSTRTDLRFVNPIDGKAIESDIQWQKKGEIVQVINSFIESLFMRTSLEGDMMLELEKISQMNGERLIDEEGNRKKVTLEIIKDFIHENKTVTFERTILDDPGDLIYIMRVLEYYLLHAGKNSLYSNFKYIVNELINNANRGNYKRAHFNIKKLDPERNYMLGMKDFLGFFNKKDSFHSREAFNMNLKVTVQFQVLGEELILSVINNYKIWSRESEEINKRFLMAHQCRDMQDLGKMDTATDEGKGQGLAILNMMLKKIGLDENFLKMRADEDQTIFRVRFPLKQLKDPEPAALAKEMIEELENIPTLPGNIMELHREINNPESTIDNIEHIVQRDPTLAARIIQVANSPIYIRMEKVRNLKEAIQIIGLKGIGNIVLAYGSYKQVEGMVNMKRLQQIVQHSEQTAFFAKEIVRKLKLKINVENVYLPALIHDIGKIVIESKTPDLYKRINELSHTKNMSVELIEDLFGGLYHNIVGYELAKKWEFPEVVGNIMKYHHEPRSADDHFDEVFLIYLANELTRFSDGTLIFENIDQNVLEFFEIKSHKELSDLAVYLDREFKEKQ